MISRREFLAGVPLAAAAIAAQAAPGKRIGFVDDNLDNFHARVYLEALRGPLKERGFVVSGAFALQQEKSKAWAAKNNLDVFGQIAELDKVVDVYAVLAPSTPKTHEELCDLVLPFGKTTFVDKTFAPDVATAERIFKKADQHKAALQSSSALRYTAVQKVVQELGRDQVRHVVAWCPGGSYDEYAVHAVELAVSCLGPDAQSLMRRGTDPESQLLINYSGGRTAVINVYIKRKTPYAASITTAKESRYLEVDTKPLFVDAASALLDFFAAGKEQVDRRETMAVMKILEASRDPAALERFVKL
ncbi:MAG TPA: Gfo/Idh/MocA family oxidoreductase [Planctomycetota bacterium]|jgi:predicted dehydrogenase|nr:Gfo/Idh/MocA family oxidoreductase [Planctomycetota bacterium]